MKLFALIILIIALAIPAGASSVVSWTQKDIQGYNLTLNYTSSFNVAKNDILGVTIKNVGNETLNDSITVKEIKVLDTDEAEGRWTGSVKIEPNSSSTIDFRLNVTTDDKTTINIKIIYEVNSYSRTLGVTANYPGEPEIESWGNNKTNDRSKTITINTSEVVRFNATANQPVDWNWYRDNVKQTNNYDNFSTSWDSSGIKTIKVNATNANGTSDTIKWTVTVNALSVEPAPSEISIISWSNNKTNDNNLNLIINQSDTVRFNFTANQTLTSWLWTLNGEKLNNPSDTLTYTFNDEGVYKVRASGSNSNGTTQTILWKVNVQENDVINEKKNAMILAWSPQVVDYVYVNDTINETIEYSITTAGSMTSIKWSKDGVSVIGDSTDNTYTYTKKWTSDDLGFHTIIFKGSNADTDVEFRWYVNVYEKGGYAGGGLFDVIDDALEHHATDVKIRMFKYKRAKYGSNSEDTADYVNRLHDEIAKRQMTREALREEFKAGDISIAEYVAALKQIQRDVKYDLQLAETMKDIEQGKDEEHEDEQDDEYEQDNEHDKEYKHNDKYESKSDRTSGQETNDKKLKKNRVKEEKKKEDSSAKGTSKEKHKGNKNKGHEDEEDDD